jgi:hypothetical protein
MRADSKMNQANQRQKCSASLCTKRRDTRWMLKFCKTFLGEAAVVLPLSLGDEHIVENLLTVPRLHSSNYRGLMRGNKIG